MAPVVHGEKGEHKDLIEQLRKDGYARIRIDGEIKDLLKEITSIDDEANDERFREITEEVRKLQSKLQERKASKILEL